MYGNGRPLGMRKRMQVVVAVVLLAWATQTLLHQWGFGAEVPVPVTLEAPPTAPMEQFVPGTGRFVAGATLELRGDATVVGGDVKLKQICRWSDSDAGVFAPVADLVVARITPRAPYRSITVEQVRSTLHDAGVNLGVVKFAGAMTCTVGRSDTAFDEQSALREWAAAKAGGISEGESGGGGEGEKKRTAPPAAAAVQAAAVVPAAPRRRVEDSAASAIVAPVQVKTLRALLLEDLAVRLGTDAERLQLTFNPKDENLLNLSEPLFKFNVDGRLIHDLGEVTWNVLILTGNGSQKGVVTATARAWQNQVVVERSLGYHQVIREADVTERRVLVDRLPYEPLLTVSQVVGQEAARELKPGTVVSGRMVDPVALVKPGQLVTISLVVGTVRVKTVGRAMEAGTYGQAVKVKNEVTQDVYEVTMTGPQVGTMGPVAGAAVVMER